MPSRLRGAAIAIALIAGAGAIVRAEIIDRILAVVDSAIITQSDVVSALRLGTVTVAGAADPTGAGLDLLIERRLMLAEVERLVPPAPPETEVSLRLEQVRLSFPSVEAFRKVLAETGRDEEALRRQLREDIRLSRYIQQRFGSAVPPSDTEILDYYRAHPERFTRAGAPLSFEEARGAAREALVSERRDALVRQWVAGLRKRANVSVLYAPR